MTAALILAVEHFSWSETSGRWRHACQFSGTCTRFTDVVELELVDVRVEEATKMPFIELRALDGSGRILPIFIGIAEAGAIKIGMEGRPTPRPLTHDLLRLVLDVTTATVDFVLVNEVRERVFYAELHLTIAGERTIVSCRPSDAIALAVRTKSKIYANDQVLEDRAVTEESDEEGEGEELVDEFKKFIDDINPEDFR